MKRGAFIALTVVTCVIGLVDGGCAGRRAAPDPDPKGPSSTQIGALQEQARRLLAAGHHARARESFEQANRLAESLDDRPSLVDITHELGNLALEDGRLSQALTLHRKGLHLAEQTGDGRRILLSVASLAAAEQQAGHTETAADLYKRGMGLARERQDRGTLAALLNNAGLLDQRTGDVEAARQAYREASAINKELGHREAEASNHANLAMLAEGLHDYDEAAREFALALDLDKAVENAHGIAADLANMGRIAVRRGYTELGLDYMDRAYRSYAAQGDRARALEALSNAVEAARQSGRMDDARRFEAESASLKALPALR